ncbi:hypothetical protein BaRGS_00004429, partial [Batillaria attramentaria]
QQETAQAVRGILQTAGPGDGPYGGTDSAGRDNHRNSAVSPSERFRRLKNIGHVHVVQGDAGLTSSNNCLCHPRRQHRVTSSPARDGTCLHLLLTFRACAQDRDPERRTPGTWRTMYKTNTGKNERQRGRKEAERSAAMAGRGLRQDDADDNVALDWMERQPLIVRLSPPPVCSNYTVLWRFVPGMFKMNFFQVVALMIAAIGEEPVPTEASQLWTPAAEPEISFVHFFLLSFSRTVHCGRAGDACGVRLTGVTTPNPARHTGGPATNPISPASTCIPELRQRCATTRPPRAGKTKLIGRQTHSAVHLHCAPIPIRVTRHPLPGSFNGTDSQHIRIIPTTSNSTSPKRTQYRLDPTHYARTECRPTHSTHHLSVDTDGLTRDTGYMYPGQYQTPALTLPPDGDGAEWEG